MIILDTHVWLWWLHTPNLLSNAAAQQIKKEEELGGIRVSVISVWEIAVKVQIKKLVLPLDMETWYFSASSYPGLTIEPLYPLDAIESTPARQFSQRSSRPDYCSSFPALRSSSCYMRSENSGL